MTKAPYTYVPVILPKDDEGLTDTPFHNKVAHESITGEVNITLTNLTPLLAGHYQYKIPDADSNIFTGNERNSYNDEKHVLEPLLLNKTDKPGSNTIEDKRVLITGTTIKGMLRHSIGAIFGSPMERVQEKFYSYRPNLKLPRENEDLKYIPKEAIIRTVKNIDTDNPILTIDLLSGLKDAHFLDEEIYNLIGLDYQKTLTRTELITYSLCKKNFLNKYNKVTTKNRIIRSRDTLPDPYLLPDGETFQIFKYQAGIDGHGDVARTFGDNGKRKDDIAILISIDVINKAVKKIRVDKEIINQFLQTKKDLVDEDCGHLKRNKEIEPYTDGIKNHNLEEGQLIYVEVDETNTVVSFGHNFRYRWRYADTVRTNNGDERDILKKLKNEWADEENVKLTATRSLFGYVDGEKDNKNETYLGISDEGDYERFAGRVSINTAIEQIEGKGINDRFITVANNSLNIPLKPLGEPCASAVEHYLKQDINQNNGAINTYGDLPSVDEEYLSSELNGRKFYRHQAKARTNYSVFKASGDEIESKHGTLARYISKENSSFKYKLRFKNLREWELGAILIVLNPDCIRNFEEAKSFLPDNMPLTKKDGIIFAQKLGYGRPLGLGSVMNTIDEINILNSNNLLNNKKDNIFDTSLHYSRYIQAFIDYSQSKELPVKEWLSVMCYSGTENIDIAYPTASVRGKNNIYNYHTGLRQTHSEQRRIVTPKSKHMQYGNKVKP